MSEITTNLREELIDGNKSIRQVTDDIEAPMNRRPNALWWAAFLCSFTMLVVGVVAVAYQIKTGIGTWGLNRTVGWAFDITNFVFWIGIGHAGTLISAVCFLFRQKWRNSINRSTEAMTIFAVICAGIFPLIHMGRPWLAYWVTPYPNDRGSLWINFRSPLMWDVMAIGTYFILSLTFWFVGLIPDLATIRDRTKPGIKQKIFAFFSMGWNASYKTWHRYELVYLLLAGLAAPLAFSVHSIVGMDFATAVIPGWHSTLFPPFFVTGAIFSGTAMGLTLLLIARKVMGLEEYINFRQIEPMCKIVLATGSIMGLCYVTEIFTAAFSGNAYEQFSFYNRIVGPLAWCFWIMFICNAVIPQLLWFRAVRKRFWIVFIVTIFVNIGMWFERFVIIVTSLYRDFLPSSWTSYAPTTIEIATLIGSFGLFFTCFLIFCRVLPVIAMDEVKSILRYGKPKKETK